ncbi:undecaprenyl-phosphate alpha-N-acetylglucosaminyl 1-phosphate transferase [Kitasatospora phosalacinea]|uniref:Undecaprenyl-phosphate alpha-N-acetylglucosaminyl 1-phosphate transferase n=1 Tax=Kitasatospora phosalacinea TaxID=2065 RepID=A0A9W6Q3N1_9ACTN|nr:MraY family glycosyltransferase [Kitasatospora phosalacinea]GLW69172.1 undecaprenyl-phosphate alpha-N-acetylglucosaminyl 1-phosphate transferase [Kitasatospora phosalacinea]
MREYLLVMFVSAAVTYLLVSPVRKFAIAAGAMPAVRARDVHREPTPRLGGIAMFGGLLAGLLAASQLSGLGRMFVQSADIKALLSGAGIMFVLGVLDDKWGVDALVKLGGQMIAAGVMVWQGVTVISIPVPGYGTVPTTPTQGMLISVVLVVVMVNAVNFIDGLDGLAAGMVCIAAMAFFLYSYRLWLGYGINDAAPAALFTAVLIGMCLGFLPHNLHPARIFMGDSGSMMLGLMLAVAAISITGRVDPDLVTAQTGSQTTAIHALVPIYIPLILPLTVIALPLADLLLAVVRRTWAGRSPFAADKQHLHHRLLEVGHSHSRAVLIMYFWAALIAFGTVAVSVTNTGRAVILSMAGLCLVGLAVLLMPRFKPRAPKAVQPFVPPRYRDGEGAGEEADAVAAAGEGAGGGTPAMAELSAEDKALLGRMGTGATAVGPRGERRS